MYSGVPNAATRECKPRLAGGSHDAEVSECDVILGIHHDIAGFDVAMDEAFSVSMVQRTCQLAYNVRYPLQRQWPIFTNHLFQGASGQVLHGEVHQPAFFANIIDSYDVGMIQLTGDIGLAFEAAYEGGIATQMGKQHLQRHQALSLCVVSFVDDGHPPASKLFLNLVVPDLVHGFHPPNATVCYGVSCTSST